LIVAPYWIYFAVGVLGGFLYCVMPPMDLDPKKILQHCVAGIVVGLIFYWFYPAGTPEILLAVLGTGYWAIDFLKALLDKFKPGQAKGSGDNVPL